ncbi:MAG TPA: hypothetical protein VGJ60_34120 [Chloroflexota bacterium]|jgi:hypothetical protein
MLSKSNASTLAGQLPTDLVLERLPNGQLAWLRPCTEAFEDDDALYVLTDKGRHDLRMAELFGPSPTVDQVRRDAGSIACQP